MINIGISPCPNDIFIFGPIMRGIIKTDLSFDFRLDDVENLNKSAIDGFFDVVRVSYGVLPHIIFKYKILTCGGALGHKNGPIVVSKKYDSIEELKGKKIAVPGFNTTAFLLFKTFFGELFHFVEMRFDKILAAIDLGMVDAGIIIHEGRFVYQNFGLTLLSDLGELWEERFSLPIPLGAIAIKNEILDLSTCIKGLIKDSIKHSFEYFEDSKEFCKKYSQELDDNVLENHISYFVNEYSMDMSDIAPTIARVLNLPENIFI
jgi:1,4-dihydroxy-6-naphthoate synthase